MSKFNTSTNHPLIPNAQQYMFDFKYVSIHSEDRDVTKYPCSSNFEIELPQDYCNVQSVKLLTWSFPSSFDTFSPSNFNVKMTFSFLEITPHNETELQTAIFNGLMANIKNEYTIIISSGKYDDGDTIATEIQNRMNASVTNYLISYLKGIGRADLIEEFVLGKGYTNFILYNDTKQNRLWFGNTNLINCPSAKFVIHNTEENVFLKNASMGKFQYTEYSLWGLGAFLGFHKNQPAVSIESPFNTNRNKYQYPRAYQEGEPTESWWLTDGRVYGEKPVFYLEAPCILNILGSKYFYMDTDLLNTMDELVPYELNNFTNHTNESSGIVNSTFAKIPLYNLSLAAQSIDVSVPTYKLFNPPAERIRKLRIRLRYHNGSLVQFSNKGFSFTLQFALFRPQNQRSYQMYIPETAAFAPIG
jgi:hypothetical protein